jgi:hypothetical protein
MAVDNFPNEFDYYNSIDELLLEDDIVETDIRVVGWDKKFRIRALTFGQMERINKNAADKEGNIQSDEFVYWTLVEGIVRPKMRIEQARRLADSNGLFLKELSDEIWSMGRISKKLWDSFIEESKRRTKIEKDDFTDEKKVEQTPE